MRKSGTVRPAGLASTPAARAPFRHENFLSKGTMNTAAVVMFVTIAGIVWGGFLLILVTAIRKEGNKAKQG